MDWLLFAEEATAAHYYWDGHTIHSLSTDGLLDHETMESDETTETLNQVLGTSRKKMFELDDLRCVVVAKGLFHQL